MEISKFKELVYPEVDTVYWYIGDEVCMGTWENVVADYARFKTGNYYEKSEEAELEFEWRELNVQILNSIALLNKGANWTVDWKNSKQLKQYLRYYEAGNILDIHYDKVYQSRKTNEYFSCGVYVKLLPLYTGEEFIFWITKEKR